MQIKSYIVTIISVVLMSFVAEGIMPDGNMKKHITLVMGIVILIAVSKPVIDFTGGLFKNGIDLEFYRSDDVSYDLTQKLENAVTEKVYNSFQTKLNNMAEEEIYSELGVNCKVETILDGNTVKYIRVHGKQSIAIENYIEKRFGIKCKFDEVGDTNEIY